MAVAAAAADAGKSFTLMRKIVTAGCGGARVFELRGAGGTAESEGIERLVGD